MPSPKSISREFYDISKQFDSAAFAKSVLSSFQDFPDPRRTGAVLFPAWFIVLVVLCGFLSGCNTIQEISYFSKMRISWFAEMLGMVVKAPSYDTIWVLLCRTKPEGFKQLLHRWFESLPTDLRDQLLALDGKRVKGASSEDKMVHIVEMFAVGRRLVVCQERVPDKKNELGALPALLNSIEVEGAILSMDAMFTQKEVAAKIVGKKADYIMGLKGNQGNLCDEAANFFEQAHAINFEEVECDFFETCDKKHGREEIRQIRVIHDLEWLPQLSDWKGLKSLIEVVSERRIGEKVEASKRFYISSRKAKAKEFGWWIRGHWAIENNLHWVADVVFGEDDATNRKGHSPENLSLIRRLAINMVNLLDPGKGLAAARTLLTYEPDYLKGFMAKLFLTGVK
jgi:predicted transposase YbfD/YdcC